MSAPQGTVLPASLALQSLLTVVPCQLTLTSSLRADNQDLSLELSQSCRPLTLSGILTHSFLGLRSHGVPQMITIEATAPGGSEQALFIKAGTCYIRANRVVEAKGRTQWLWALESKCPMLQVWMITKALTPLSITLIFRNEAVSIIQLIIRTKLNMLQRSNCSYKYN